MPEQLTPVLCEFRTCQSINVRCAWGRTRCTFPWYIILRISSIVISTITFLSLFLLICRDVKKNWRFYRSKCKIIGLGFSCRSQRDSLNIQASYRKVPSRHCTTKDALWTYGPATGIGQSMEYWGDLPWKRDLIGFITRAKRIYTALVVPVSTSTIVRRQGVKLHGTTTWLCGRSIWHISVRALFG